MQEHIQAQRWVRLGTLMLALPQHTRKKVTKRPLVLAARPQVRRHATTAHGLCGASAQVCPKPYRAGPVQVSNRASTGNTGSVACTPQQCQQCLKQQLLQQQQQRSLDHAEYSNLPCLCALALCSNTLTGLPEDFSKLQGIRMLRIKYNQLSRLPAPVLLLPQLATLELSGNQIVKLDSAVAKVSKSSKTKLHCCLAAAPP